MASVWYIGFADVRTIDTAEWTRVEAPGSTSTWDKSNGWSISQASFTAPQLAILGALDEFTLTGTNGPRPGAVVSASVDSALTLSDMLEYIDRGGALPVTLTDQATIALDASESDHYRVTLAGSRTLANPTWGDAPKDGKRILLEIIQGGTGSYTITWGNKYAFTTTFAQPTLNTAVGKRDFVEFVYNSTADLFYCTSIVKGA